MAAGATGATPDDSTSDPASENDEIFFDADDGECEDDDIFFDADDGEWSEMVICRVKADGDEAEGDEASLDVRSSPPPSSPPRANARPRLARPAPPELHLQEALRPGENEALATGPAEATGDAPGGQPQPSTPSAGDQAASADPESVGATADPAPWAHRLAAAQREDGMHDEEFMAAHPARALRLAVMEGETLLVDDARAQARPLVPHTVRLELVSRFHQATHAGVKATRRAVDAWYLVPDLGRVTRVVVRYCEICRRSKPSPAEKPAIKAYEPPVGKFLDMHIDFAVLLPSKGCRYLMTVVDRATRWPDAYPLAGCTAPEAINAFLNGWVARHGVPRSIVTDQGPQFTSALWSGGVSAYGDGSPACPCVSPCH